MSIAPNVTVIPAKAQSEINRSKYQQLRVAAYCRVSTEQEEQQSSYQVQIAYYTDLINRKKEWSLDGIFADEGISGTQIKNRTEFKRMIRMCKNKKIDLVITKSISRFARNTVDCLEYVRQLKDLGIGVIFEKENINTLDLHISRGTLYRKLRAWEEYDIYGLVDKRGGWNKKSSSIPSMVWEAFLWYWLDENRPTVSLCYRNTVNWTEQFYPELVDLIPTERSFRRHIENDVKYAVKVLMRDGEKAFNDRCLPYMMRMYDKLEANECWIADNHTFDIQSYDDEEKIHRLYLTAFLDAKTGVLTGWNVTDSPDSQSTILALRHGIMRFGAPKSIYVDNGREFLTADLGGNGHRAKKGSEEISSTILKRLGIEMHNAIVCNARAKPIERMFYTSSNTHRSNFSADSSLERIISL